MAAVDVWMEVPQLLTVQKMWFVVELGFGHGVQAEFEAVLVVVEVQKIGYELKTYESWQSLGLLVLWASTQPASCSVQEEVAQ